MKAPSIFRIGMTAIAAISPLAASAQFVPPAGYGGNMTRPGVAAPADPDAPLLTRPPDTAMSGLVHVDPGYSRRNATGHAKVVGVFQIAETPKRHVVAAWSPGFMPVTLSFDDGTCYALRADYIGGTMSNGRLDRTSCDARAPADQSSGPTPPPGRKLRWIGGAWGHDAWVDDRAGKTIVTAPSAATFRPLFTVDMPTSHIMAMAGPDYPGGNITLVGRIGKRLTVMTLEVSY